eukprot:COSAG01_NODE_129_length_24935_cov_39.324368_12_plen_142_part_00
MFNHFPNPPACLQINDGVWDTRIAAFRNSTGAFEYIGGDRAPWLPRGVAGPATCTDNPPAGAPSWDSAMTATVRGLIVRPQEGVIRMLKWGDVKRHGQSLFNHSATRFSGEHMHPYHILYNMLVRHAVSIMLLSGICSHDV